MSKTKKITNYFNKKQKNNLLSQQNIIIEKYENNKDNSNNKNALLSPKNTNDLIVENWDNIKHTLTELPQYSSLYSKRLEMTKQKLIEECKQKWPKIHICQNIVDLKGNVIKYFY